MPLMPLIDPINRAAYVSCVRDLLTAPQVQSMRALPHHPGLQCFDHPVFALRNASALTPLTAKERNIILAHMWPLAFSLPRSREAWVVTLADKLCATAEVLGVWRRLKMRCILAA